MKSIWIVQQIEKLRPKKYKKTIFTRLKAATPDRTTDFRERKGKFAYLTEDNNRPNAVTKVNNRDYVRRR